MPGLFGVTPGGGLIPVTPQAREYRRQMKWRGTPQLPSSLGFSKDEIMERPELQRGAIRPSMLPFMEEQYQRRLTEEKRKKIEMLYQKASEKVDLLDIPEGYKPLVKAGIQELGPKVALEFLKDFSKDREATKRKTMELVGKMEEERVKQEGASKLETQKQKGRMELEKEKGRITVLGEKQKPGNQLLNYQRAINQTLKKYGVDSGMNIDLEKGIVEIGNKESVYQTLQQKAKGDIEAAGDLQKIDYWYKKIDELMEAPEFQMTKKLQEQQQITHEYILGQGLIPMKRENANR